MPTYECLTKSSGQFVFGGYKRDEISVIVTGTIRGGGWMAGVFNTPHCPAAEVALYSAATIGVSKDYSTENEALEALCNWGVTVAGILVKAGKKTSDEPKELPTPLSPDIGRGRYSS